MELFTSTDFKEVPPPPCPRRRSARKKPEPAAAPVKKQPKPAKPFSTQQIGMLVERFETSYEAGELSDLTQAQFVKVLQLILPEAFGCDGEMLAEREEDLRARREAMKEVPPPPPPKPGLLSADDLKYLEKLKRKQQCVTSPPSSPSA